MFYWVFRRSRLLLSVFLRVFWWHIDIFWPFLTLLLAFQGTFWDQNGVRIGSFWVTLDYFWVFPVILGLFWQHSGIVLVLCWPLFGTISVHFFCPILGHFGHLLRPFSGGLRPFCGLASNKVGTKPNDGAPNNEPNCWVLPPSSNTFDNSVISSNRDRWDRCRSSVTEHRTHRIISNQGNTQEQRRKGQFSSRFKFKCLLRIFHA